MQGEVLLRAETSNEGGGVNVQEGVVSRQRDNRGTSDKYWTTLSRFKTTFTITHMFFISSNFCTYEINFPPKRILCVISLKPRQHLYYTP